jgi:hypothetical protein
MSTKIRKGRLLGLVGILTLVAFTTSLPLAVPGGALTFCGGPGQPPCPPPPPPPPPPLCGTPGTALCGGTLLTTYYDTTQPISPPSSNLPSADNLLRLINPLGCANGGFPGCTVRNQCAMIYVFDSNENLGECCGCPLTPQQLISLSVEQNLTKNWAPNPPPPAAGVVDIISAAPNETTCASSQAGCNGGCYPAAPYTTSRELNGYILHTQPPGIPRSPTGGER